MSTPIQYMDRLEKAEAKEYQKWDYITLADFTSSSFGKFFSYGWLWFLSIIAVAVYASDTFTAIQLVVFRKWNSQVQPTIPFDISRWIFAGCILFSWVLCIFEWIRAVRVIKRANVAESYLDPLASRLQSLRVTKEGQGWRRFLVFLALTKSKKGTDYIALFTYFQFKGSVRILLAEGPRQVINGMTLYSVMKADLYPAASNDPDGSAIAQFWHNVEILAKEHEQQAIILFTMLFTGVIWAVSFISFVVACISYLTFLWHYIPSADGGLSRYCRRKVDQRLGRIVNAKAKKAMEKLEAKQRRRDEKAEKQTRKNGELPIGPTRRPTLPEFTDSEDSLSEKTGATISRQPTFTTDSSLTRTDSLSSSITRQPTLPSLDEMRPLAPSRTYTQSSVTTANSSSSNLPLLGGAASMGKEDGTDSQQPRLPPALAIRPPPRHVDYPMPGPDSRNLPGPRMEPLGRPPNQGQRPAPPPLTIPSFDRRPAPSGFRPPPAAEGFELQPPRRGPPPQTHNARPPPLRSYSQPIDERRRPRPPPEHGALEQRPLPEPLPQARPQPPAAYQQYRSYSPQNLAAPHPPPQQPLPQRPTQRLPPPDAF